MSKVLKVNLDKVIVSPLWSSHELLLHPHLHFPCSPSPWPLKRDSCPAPDLCGVPPPPVPQSGGALSLT